MYRKLVLAAAACCLALGAFAQKTSWKTEEIYIRDPFVLVDQEHGCYYLYRSAYRDAFGNSDDNIGSVEVFKSTDLQNWEGPETVLNLPPDNWITGKIWAPEVHKYKGKYYIFATINTDLKWKGSQNMGCDYTFRGTQVFWSKSPEGPFQAFDRVPYTPQDQMCLDGTFWVEDGQPWMVYCHEWVEAVDGEMVAVKLKKDLSGTEGRPLRLFCASAAPWVAGDMLVTDGPFLYRTKNGRLLMIWSSIGRDGYTLGMSESTTGKVTGPWKHPDKTLFTEDGGHGMIFRALDGKLYLTLHAPNHDDLERAHFFELEDTGDDLVIKK